MIAMLYLAGVLAAAIILAFAVAEHFAERSAARLAGFRVRYEHRPAEPRISRRAW